MMHFLLFEIESLSIIIYFAFISPPPLALKLDLCYNFNDSSNFYFFELRSYNRVWSLLKQGINNVKQFECKLCKDCFDTIQELQNHLNEKHSEVRENFNAEFLPVVESQRVQFIEKCRQEAILERNKAEAEKLKKETKKKAAGKRKAKKNTQNAVDLSENGKVTQNADGDTCIRKSTRLKLKADGKEIEGRLGENVENSNTPEDHQEIGNAVPQELPPDEVLVSEGQKTDTTLLTNKGTLTKENDEIEGEVKSLTNSISDNASLDELGHDHSLAQQKSLNDDLVKETNHTLQNIEQMDSRSEIDHTDQNIEPMDSRAEIDHTDQNIEPMDSRAEIDHTDQNIEPMDSRAEIDHTDQNIEPMDSRAEIDNTDQNVEPMDSRAEIDHTDQNIEQMDSRAEIDHTDQNVEPMDSRAEIDHTDQNVEPMDSRAEIDHTDQNIEPMDSRAEIDHTDQNVEPMDSRAEIDHTDQNVEPMDSRNRPY